jgi:hypothetical protein
MQISKRFAAVAAAGAALCVFACKDVPLLPKWNADWNLPLPSQAIKNIFGVTPVTIPAGTSANVSFTQSQAVDGPIGGLLKQDLSNASFIVTVTKSIPLSGNDTLFIAADTFAFSNPAATRIVIPITLVATNVGALKDSIAPNPTVSAAGLAMLQNVANSGGTLWIRMKGQVTYAGPPNPGTVQPGDSVLLKLALLSTIAISR